MLIQYNNGFKNVLAINPCSYESDINNNCFEIKSYSKGIAYPLSFNSEKELLSNISLLKNNGFTFIEYTENNKSVGFHYNDNFPLVLEKLEHSQNNVFMVKYFRENIVIDFKDTIPKDIILQYNSEAIFLNYKKSIIVLNKNTPFTYNGKQTKQSFILNFSLRFRIVESFYRTLLEDYEYEFTSASEWLKFEKKLSSFQIIEVIEKENCNSTACFGFNFHKDIDIHIREYEYEDCDDYVELDYEDHGVVLCSTKKNLLNRINIITKISDF